jgi:chloride channel protein, CIC family
VSETGESRGRRLRPETAERLRRVRQRWSETLLLASITGAVTGFAVAIFDLVVADQLFARIRDLGTPWIWVAPAIGLGLAWAVLRWLGHGASPSTSDDYIQNFHEQDRRMPLRAMPAKVLASVVTLGFGGALGYEGPAIYIGAAAGTWLQRRFRRIFGIQDAKLLMIVGAAAGVAAIFRTPLTGALFAIEVPYQQDQARRAAMPALIGAATSYVTFVLVRGTERVIPVSGQPSFRLADLLGAVVVGILCGAGARGFALLVGWSKALNSRLPQWASWAIGGGSMAILTALSITLFHEPLAMGPGYGSILRVESPTMDLALIAALFLIRAAASSATIAGGGAGGVFIPLVTQGALLGRLVGGIAHVPEVTLLPLVGAAAFLGAGYRVPIAAVVFVAESTGRAGFIVPGVIATVVAQLMMGSSSVTPYQVPIRGGHVEQRLRLPVSEAMRRSSARVDADAPIDQAIDAVFVRAREASVPIVRADGSYEGMLRLADVAAVRARERDAARVGDLSVAAPAAAPTWTLMDAVAAMEEADVDCLAVVEGTVVTGVVALNDALRLDEVMRRAGGSSTG